MNLSACISAMFLILLSAQAFAQEGFRKIVWRENTFNIELYDSLSETVIDEEYFRSATPEQRAAIGFVATFTGNDCWWDGDYTADRSNLKCRILSALDLSYQCSNQHLGYLRHWFRYDTVSLERLEDCKTVPFTSTIQDTFDSISIYESDNVIIIIAAITGVNIREELEWHILEETIFRKEQDFLAVISRKTAERD